MARDKERRRARAKKFKEEHGYSLATAWNRSNPEAHKRHIERQRAYRLTPEGKAKTRRYSRDDTLRDKLGALDAYGGPVCVCCGEQHIAFLTLDHINNDGAEHRRQLGIGREAKIYDVLRSRGYPNDWALQVLCYNCNCGKRANGGVCPHKEGA